jgi:hypothetical protein
MGYSINFINVIKMPVQPLQVGNLGTGDRVFYTTFALAGSTAANTPQTGTIYPYGIDDGTTFQAFQIPTGVRYNLIDIVVSSTPTTDGQLTFYVNGNKQGENFFIADLVSANNARMRPSQPIVAAAGSTLTVKLSLTATSPTANTTQTLKMHFLVVPDTS